MRYYPRIPQFSGLAAEIAAELAGSGAVRVFTS